MDRLLVHPVQNLQKVFLLGDPDYNFSETLGISSDICWEKINSDSIETLMHHQYNDWMIFQKNFWNLHIISTKMAFQEHLLK